MNIRHELHPIALLNGKFKLPNAPYTMSSKEKIRFLRVLKHIKASDGYVHQIKGFLARLNWPQSDEQGLE